MRYSFEVALDKIEVYEFFMNRIFLENILVDEKVIDYGVLYMFLESKLLIEWLF